MIHTFKKGKDRYVRDLASGQVSPVTALQFKMLSYLKPPLTPELPTSLRYDLAKYDSGSVEDAYEGLYALFEEGRLFSGSEKEDVCGSCEFSSVCGMKK